VRYWDKRGLDPPARNTFGILRGRTAYRYRTPPPVGRAYVVNTDMRSFSERSGAGMDRPVRLVVTSPPYLNVTNFEEDQWLRLWFLGGVPEPTRKTISPDDRHYSEGAYWPLIADMWESISKVAGRGAHIVVRIGGNGLTPERLFEGLTETAESVVSGIRPVGKYRVSDIKGRQTGSFRPGSKGCLVEVDAVFKVGSPVARRPARAKRSAALV
jgi:hypothetical protein